MTTPSGQPKVPAAAPAQRRRRRHRPFSSARHDDRTPSQERQNYHQDSEAAINRQIHLELYASCVYRSMSCDFDRDDVALKNFAKSFLHQSHEEREHAERLMKLQTMMTGRMG